MLLINASNGKQLHHHHHHHPQPSSPSTIMIATPATYDDIEANNNEENESKNVFHFGDVIYTLCALSNANI